MTEKKKAKGKMNFKEWRIFVSNIVAGIFGGIVILAWSLGYEAVKNDSFFKIITIPNILAISLFVLLIFVLKYLLVDKKKKRKVKGGKNNMCLNWKRLIRAFGIAFVAFSSAWIGWSFSFTWENKFLWMVLFLIVGAVLSSLD
jgi:hypothetical protein